MRTVPPSNVPDAAPTAEDVHRAYRLFLGREAESAAVVASHVARGGNLGALFTAFMNSEEFVERIATQDDARVLADALHARLAVMPAGPANACPSGFWRDPIGMTVPDDAGAYWQKRRGNPDDAFKGQEIEWWALLDAAQSAGERLTLVELGCGYGPWLARGALAMRRLRGGAAAMTLVGVEGEPSHVAMLGAHFARNGLGASMPRIWQGAIAIADGEMEFEASPDDNAHWGTRRSARSDDPFLPRVHEPRAIRVPCWGLATVLTGLGPVDLLHVDIQGDEASVLTAGADALTRQVRRLVVGTHGRGIEQALMERLLELGFTLVGEKACRYAIRAGRPILVEDGAQYWRNRAFDRPA